MPLTLKERERIAYANGDVETAALLREAIEGQSRATDFELDEAYGRGYDEGYRDGKDHD